MAELVRRWSELVLADLALGFTLTRAARESGSLLRPPASDHEISVAEERLGRALPPSYREFLLVSDGAYGDVHGASCALSEDGWEVAEGTSAVVGVGFLPVADLRWLRDAHPDVAEMYSTAGPGPERVPATVDGAELRSWTAFADGLQIAMPRMPGLTCLVPFEGDEWQVWNIVTESSQGFLSFRSMLEDRVAELEPITTLDEFDEVLARASDGDHQAARRIRQTTVPEAVPRLVNVIAGGRFEGLAIAALGRIGTDEAVSVLAQLEPYQAVGALAVAGTQSARDVLAQRGDFYTLSLLGDPRGAQLAAVRLADRSPSDTASSLSTILQAIARSRDPRYVPLLMPLLSGRTTRGLGPTAAKDHRGRLPPIGRRA